MGFDMDAYMFMNMSCTEINQNTEVCMELVNIIVN